MLPCRSNLCANQLQTVRIEKSVLCFCNLFYEIYIVKNSNIQLKLKFCKIKNIFSRELALAHPHNVENHHIMEDDFPFRYVLKYPGVNSRAELVPSPLAHAPKGGSRRCLRQNLPLTYSSRFNQAARCALAVTLG